MKTSWLIIVGRHTSKFTLLGLTCAGLLSACNLNGGIVALREAAPVGSGRVALSINSSSLSINEGSSALLGFALAEPLTSEATI